MNGQQDNWVVAHIHIDPTHQSLFLPQGNGDVFIGTPSIRLFHAQTVVQPRNGERRADGGRVPPVGAANAMRYANTRSPLIDCPRDANPLYYLGTQPIINTGTTPPTFRQALSNWARRLWEGNVLNSYGLSYIFDQPGNVINSGAQQFVRNLPRPAVLVPWQGLPADDPTLYNFVWNPTLGVFERPNV
jgi:chitinase